MKSKYVRSLTYNVTPLSIKAPVVNAAIDGIGQLNYLIDSSIKEIIRWANRDYSSSDTHYGERHRYVYQKDTLDFIVDHIKPEYLSSVNVEVNYDEYGEPWCYTLTRKSKRELRKMGA